MPDRLNSKQERALLERALEDYDAFRAIYEHYFPRVYTYVSYRMARKQDAEDIVSDAFLKAVKRLDTFEWRGDGSFSAWLFRITSNLIADYYRRVGREADEISMDELSEILPDQLLPHDAVRQKETFLYLRELIGVLPQRRREVILLKFYGGLRNMEIAQVLGLDERTVASHLCRGLDDLHRRYVLAFAHPEKEGSHE